MKGKAGRIGLVALLAAALLASVIGVSLLWSAPKGKAAEAKAAMPEGVAPDKTVACGVCGKTAYRITTLAELSYVVSQWGNGTEKTETCYVLDVPAADGETERKVDISGWADQSIGSVSEAYTGHFDGNGYKIVYEVTGENASGVQKQGLFPQLKDASVRNFTAVVKHTVSSLDAAYRSGGVAGRAENSVIENVTVSETFAHNEGAAALSGGIAGEIDKTSTVRNSSVVSTSRTTSGHHTYGGIAGAVTGGTVENCVFTLAGTNPKVGNFGGIAKVLSIARGEEASGNIIGCRVYFPISGAQGTGTNIGGIVSEMYSGRVADCTAEISINGMDAAAGRIGGIAGSVLSSTAAADGSKQGTATIENCYAYTRKEAGGGQTGKLLGTTEMGGLVGGIGSAAQCRMQPVTIEDCRAEISAIGSVANRGANRGGLVGLVMTSANILVRNCESGADVYGTESVGGLVGRVDMDGALASFLLYDSHSYAGTVSATMTGAGGAVGRLVPKNEDLSYTAGSISILNSTARGTVSGEKGGQGGFLGYFRLPKNSTMQVSNCAAYGDVSGPVSLGGFIGYVLGHSGATLRVSTSTASGNVTGTTDTACNVGGFIGNNNCDNSVFSACVASGDVAGAYYLGGFVGQSAGNGIVYGGESRVEGCVASGRVYTTGVSGISTIASCMGAGGFVGYGTSTSVGTKYGYSSASGQVEADGGAKIVSGIGGFAGMVVGGNFASCSASGDVLYTSGKSSVSGSDQGYGGGFIGFILPGIASVMDSCTSYGDNISNVLYMYHRGGLIGRVQAPTTITNCVSYTNVISNLECVVLGGLIGSSYGNDVRVTGCTVYGTVTGIGNGAGDLLGRIESGSGLYFTSCRYVDTSLPTVWQGNTVQTDCSGMAAVALPKVAAVKNGGQDAEQPATALALTFSGCDGYSMVSLYLSLDGGINYTQFVTNGIPLIAGMTAADLANLASADGGDKTINLSYAAKSTAANIKIRITISSGSNTITKTL